MLAPSYPEAVPELLAYMLEIMGQAKQFHGKTWVLYDPIFCRQASAASGSRQWAAPSMLPATQERHRQTRGVNSAYQCHIQRESALLAEVQAEHSPQAVHNRDLCSFSAILVYMVQRRPEKGPFFRFTKSCFLTREHLVSGSIVTDRDRCSEVRWSQLPYWGQRQQQHNVANQIHG